MARLSKLEEVAKSVRNGDEFSATTIAQKQGHKYSGEWEPRERVGQD